MLAEDGHGFGQPVCLALLKNEKANLLNTFLKKFRDENGVSSSVQVIFVKKFFTQRRILEDVFPGAAILLHPLHVLKVSMGD